RNRLAVATTLRRSAVILSHSFCYSSRSGSSFAAISTFHWRRFRRLAPAVLEPLTPNFASLLSVHLLQPPRVFAHSRAKTSRRCGSYRRLRRTSPDLSLRHSAATPALLRPFD